MNAIARAEYLAAGLALVVLGVVGWWVYRHREGFNPLSDKNYASQAASAVVSQVLGRDESVGTAAYELATENPIARGWRGLFGSSTADVNYSGAVTVSEKRLVRENVNTPRDYSN